MKRRNGGRLLAAAVATILLACTPWSRAAAQSAEPEGTGLEGLSWLAGCWRLESGRRVTDEQWMAPGGGLMMGMSRTTIAGELRGTERLVIRRSAGAGGLEYVADPLGQRETVFTGSVDGGVWTFSNEAHDFPQRIVYRPAEPDSLLARIEGVVEGELRTVDFPMRRVSCAAPGVRPRRP